MSNSEETAPENTYLCEVCGKEEKLTEKAAFDAGWDYPPFMGEWGVISPRTCGNCRIVHTAWFHIIAHGGDALPENHLKTIERILCEVPHE